jgi:hypothetical protein
MGIYCSVQNFLRSSLKINVSQEFETFCGNDVNAVTVNCLCALREEAAGSTPEGERKTAPVWSESMYPFPQGPNESRPTPQSLRRDRRGWLSKPLAVGRAVVCEGGPARSARKHEKSGPVPEGRLICPLAP